MFMQSIIKSPHSGQEIELCIYGTIVDFVIRIEVAHLVLHAVADLMGVHAMLEIDVGIADPEAHGIAGSFTLIRLALIIPGDAENLVTIGQPAAGIVILIIGG